MLLTSLIREVESGGIALHSAVFDGTALEALTMGVVHAAVAVYVLRKIREYCQFALQEQLRARDPEEPLPFWLGLVSSYQPS